MAFPDVSEGLAQSLGGGMLELSEISRRLRHTEKHWHAWAPGSANSKAASPKSSL